MKNLNITNGTTIKCLGQSMSETVQLGIHRALKKTLHLCISGVNIQSKIRKIHESQQTAIHTHTHTTAGLPLRSAQVTAVQSSISSRVECIKNTNKKAEKSFKKHMDEHYQTHAHIMLLGRRDMT
jgi:radical SAM superfamily enzyme